MREYDLIADWYSSDRGISVKEALTAVAPLLSGPRVLVDKAFDAAIAWGMLFHPTPRDQATAFASVSRVLKGGAPFLFTAAEIRDVGDNDPGITATMNGVTFHYYAIPDYSTFIDQYGFELVDVVDDPGVSTYYFARRKACSLSR